MTLKVTSEIGKLKSVLVHLPGPEIDRMVPAMMEELLFDDILYGNRAREEHRRFQQVLGYVADEVLEIQDLLEEVLQVPEQRGAILDDLAKTLGWGPDMDYRLRDLSAEQVACLIDTALRFLRTNVSGKLAPMTTYGGFRRTTRRDDPSERLWVYGRARLPCRRCGTAIRVRKQGSDARLTYWCPRCQPAPAENDRRVHGD